MTARENAKELIGKGKPERVGLFDCFWPELVRKWKTEGHIEDETEDMAVTLNMDIIGVGGWIDSLPLRGYRKVLEETDDWQIVENGAGAELKWWKNKSGTPEHMNFHMSSREIWEKEYRSHLLETDDERLYLPVVKKRFDEWKDNDKFTVFGDMFIWEALRQSAGDVCMFESLILEPEWIHDFNRVYTDFYKNHFGRLMEVCGKPDGVMLYDDLGYKNGLFCSPQTLWELYFPYYKEIVDFFHEKGIYVILHSCGGIEAALPMITAAGFDALNPMEVKAGCNVVKFAEQYGGKLAFVGGFDVRILESGDRALIKRDVGRFMRDMKSVGARFFFGSDHSCSDKVDYDGYMAALEAYRENMLY